MKIKHYLIFLFALLFLISCGSSSKSNSSSSSSSPSTVSNKEVGQVKFNIGSSTFKSNKISQNLLFSEIDTAKDSCKKILVSITDNSNNAIYTDKEVELYKMGTDFISAPLSLEIGKTYILTKFIVFNDKNEAVFSSPTKDSKLAKLVSKPLPIEFTVQKDEVNKLSPEVILVDSTTNAKDFGYSTFTFTVIEKFQFKLAVMIYDEGLKNWKLTDSSFEIIDLGTSKTLNSGDLTAITNTIDVPSNNFSGYTLKITKTGYQSYQKNFTKTELQVFFTSPLQVMLKVKTGTVVDHYIDNGDGTITDNKTKLMWKKCQEGLSGNDCSVGSPIFTNWGSALSIGDNAIDFGYNDWRLPTINELSTIIDMSYSAPTLNQLVFPNTKLENPNWSEPTCKNGWFWSSSPCTYAGYGAMVVNFCNGVVDQTNVSWVYYLRLVRSTQ